MSHELFTERIKQADEEQVVRELCKLYVLEEKSPQYKQEWKEKIEITRNRLIDIISWKE